MSPVALQPLDLAAIPYVPCRDQYARTQPWTWVCIHEAQVGEGASSRTIANILQNPPRTAGIHDSVSGLDVTCSADVETMTVPHCYTPSAWSWGIEHVGYTDDVDPPADVLAMSARLVVARLEAWEARRGHPMPLVHLDPQQIVDKAEGFASHWDATQATWILRGGHVIGDGIDHYDGRTWPWPDYFDAIADVRRQTKGSPPGEDDDDVNSEVRYGFEPTWAVAVGSPIGGRLPVVEVDAREGSVRGYNGVAFVQTGTNDRSLMDGDPSVGGLTAVDVSNGRLNAGPVRFTIHDDGTDDVVFVTQGGPTYRFTAVAP